MSDSALNTILQQYTAQRKYRQSKRNEYLRRFQVFKQKHSHQPHQHTHQQSHPPKIQGLAQQKQIDPHVEGNRLAEAVHLQQHHPHVQKGNASGEQSELVKQNEWLKMTLVTIEAEQRDKLLLFKNQIQNVRNKYLGQIQKMTETAKTNKLQIEQKILKIQDQSDAAAKKNVQIEQTNGLLKGQVDEANKLMGQYATEIKKEYSQKIVEFEKIFNTSNQKIEAMEKEFNQDQFIENTLKNEELLKSIEQNAQKAEEAGKILEDYTTLLEGKKQILVEINSNIGMKERQIQKMIELEGKMKLIMDKLTAQKKIYVSENNKMASELLQIKNLLMGVMGQEK